ncbi:MAG: ATP-binding cassette domain-containing protein, partial [Acidobacteria bacterium]
DHVLDLGPGAGQHGGRVVAAGTPGAVAQLAASATGRYLREGPSPARNLDGRRLVPGIRVRHARCHNLRDLDVDLPAGGLVAVTGVSGSGKSTLVFDVIAPAVSAMLPSRAEALVRPKHQAPESLPAELESPVRTGLQACPASVELVAPFVRVVTSAGQTPSGAAGSMTATLAGVFDRLRDLFAATAAAREQGSGKKHFSLAAKGGRCEACEGLGRTRVSMDFLPDVWVPCEECGGRRYGPSALACRWDGRSIADVLDMTAAHAHAVFAGEPVIANRLRVLEDLGLGYLRLGQSARTLSGGERQRLALAAELMREAAGPTLFLFDEPTTGLHVDDVARLLRVLDRLVRAGHTVVVVEHHLDVIGAADWVLDLGPEGGDGGGRLVAEGTPGQVARTPGSWTGRALSEARLRLG